MQNLSLSRRLAQHGFFVQVVVCCTLAVLGGGAQPTNVEVFVAADGASSAALIRNQYFRHGRNTSTSSLRQVQVPATPPAVPAAVPAQAAALPVAAATPAVVTPAVPVGATVPAAPAAEAVAAAAPAQPTTAAASVQAQPTTINHRMSRTTLAWVVIIVAAVSSLGVLTRQVLFYYSRVLGKTPRQPQIGDYRTLEPVSRPDILDEQPMFDGGEYGEERLEPRRRTSFAEPVTAGSYSARILAKSVGHKYLEENVAAKSAGHKPLEEKGHDNEDSSLGLEQAADADVAGGVRRAGTSPRPSYKDRRLGRQGVTRSQLA